MSVIKKQSFADLQAKDAPNRIIREVFSAETLNAVGLTFRIVDIHPVTEQKPRYPHWHEGFEEMIYIMSGTGRFWADGTWTDVTAGDTLLIPSHVVHATFNLSDDPLQLFCFFPVSAGVDDRKLADFTVNLD